MVALGGMWPLESRWVYVRQPIEESEGHVFMKDEVRGWALHGMASLAPDHHLWLLVFGGLVWLFRCSLGTHRS